MDRAGGEAHRLADSDQVLRIAADAWARSRSLDWALVLGRRHVEKVLREYVRHYNHQRPHRGLDLGVPSGRPAPLEPVSLTVRRHDILGGLVHEYEPVAA